ncbi:Lrp/AsnC family transcriptional regulator [Saccharopolyspora sp. NPDC050389]|uniref:Lrp/AsnC family transcriptional regulator n=1 Tax=Saccharopolyspora sp. NPDC050389 TaxID=3155516 RepID=UPI0034099863
MTSAFGHGATVGRWSIRPPFSFPRGRYGKRWRSCAADSPRASIRRTDATDRGILQELRACARTSFELLAQVSGLAASSVKRHIGRLEASGVIRGHTFQADRRASVWGRWPCSEPPRRQAPPVRSRPIR